MSADFEYYQKRERQERENAERTEDQGARRIHIEMADRYLGLMERHQPAPPPQEQARA